jgi:hypothetical protein
MFAGTMSVYKVTAIVIACVGLSIGISLFIRMERAPAWITRAPQNGKAFYAVGSVTGVRNEPLAWDVAENRARAEIVKTCEDYTTSLMRHYLASTSPGDSTPIVEE